MATNKSFTSIEQSKKLAEILPLESADMHYNNASIKGTDYVDAHKAELMDYNAAQKVLSMFVNPLLEVIPCWSLAALLEVLPRIHHLKPILDLEECSIQYSGSDIYITADNPVDVCYETVLKLHELNLL